MSTQASIAHAESHVLALNSGSSSLKFGLYRVRGATALCLLSGEAEGLGQATASFHAVDAKGVLLLREVEKRTGIIAQFAACFRDHRDPARSHPH